MLGGSFRPRDMSEWGRSADLFAPGYIRVGPLGGSFRPRDISEWGRSADLFAPRDMSEWGRSADLRNRRMILERVAQAAFTVSPTRTASKSANTLNDAL